MLFLVKTNKPSKGNVRWLMTTFPHALYKLEFCEHIQPSAQSDQISVNIVKSVEKEESPVQEYGDSLELCLQIGILSTRQKK